MDRLVLHKHQEMQGLPCLFGKDAAVSSLLLLLEVSGWRGITAYNYWGVFPWVCGGAVHLCVYDQSVSRMSDVETSVLAALPLKAGLLRGPDGGAGVVNAGRRLLYSPLQQRRWEEWKRLAQSCGNTHRHSNTAPGKK